MEQRFSGKGVIVTGAGRGIGAAVAMRFAAEGAEVMLVGRGSALLEQVAQQIAEAGGKALVQPGDVTDEAQAQAVIDAAEARWGRIDVLVNNAGIDDETPFLDMQLAKWDAVLATNLRGPFLMGQRAARVMARSGGGVILNNASIDATAADGSFASYNASKAGLLGLNRTMAMELAAHNIRVNAVSPGFTHTAMTEKAVGPKLMEYLNGSFARVPMRRLVKPSEIAAAFAFLASDDASFITGQNLIVDGGLTANLFILETLPS